MSSQGTIIAYSATTISTMGRFVFMYLLYSRKSTNSYSLLFSVMNIVSSSMWITYSQIVHDTPLFVRGTSDLILFVISASYIMRNRMQLNNAVVCPEPIV
jgi:uncharacterized protein with PQ loop repeat